MLDHPSNSGESLDHNNLSGRGMNTSQINLASGLKARKTIEDNEVA